MDNAAGANSPHNPVLLGLLQPTPPAPNKPEKEAGPRLGTELGPGNGEPGLGAGLGPGTRIVATGSGVRTSPGTITRGASSPGRLPAKPPAGLLSDRGPSLRFANLDFRQLESLPPPGSSVGSSERTSFYFPRPNRAHPSPAVALFPAGPAQSTDPPRHTPDREGLRVRRLPVPPRVRWK